MQINRLKELIDRAEKYDLDFNEEIDEKKSLGDFNLRKKKHIKDSIENEIRRISKIDHPLVSELLVAESIDEIRSILEDLEKADIKEEIILKTSLPPAIRKEVEADISEIKKCFDNGLYRSAVILCGRVLEVALHRKYYDITSNDILETSPGIGLGKLIAKLKERKVSFPPGITQQIHLINQIRIRSVHKKSTLFYPSREQTQAIMLYTMDVLNKLL